MGSEDGQVDTKDALGKRLVAQSPAHNAELEEQEWEITKIVGKRRVGKVYEYKVRWRSTWLPRRELGNAQQLLEA